MVEKIRLKRDCGDCKYLCKYPFVECDLDVETECYYLDKEKTTFGCRPKYAFECKKIRLKKLNAK